ncbi:MAG: hypothetical protein C0617_15175 [Desulfuromonas sp.]|uniref:oligosaccharide flippase family protein n=1 Tax=Desulfuromonas sp. TaxID=892 RepID=UPI000CA79857|nr:oligosaccharide flippase family protein [Desulfuromonas sp.]PLX82001.1 MAG: hypothetical protein C0617_15175 [Desulfuromonas sp.]
MGLAVPVGKAQVPRNLSMNIVSFLVNLLVALWLVPYLIKHLGTSAYGLIPLAMIFSEYISIITQSFNSSVNRFLTFEIQKGDIDEAVIVFNSSVFVVFLFAGIQIIVLTLILSNIENVITVPAGLKNDALWLFALTFGGFGLSILSTVFSVSMYSQNRLDLMRVNDLSRTLLRFVVIIALFSYSGPALVHVGVGNFFGGLIVLVLSVFRWRNLTPDLKLNLRKAEFKKLRSMATMSGWVLINQVGFLLFLRIDTYLVNKFIGPEACGEYAAVLQWNQVVRTAAGVLAGAITPLVIIYHARGESKKLIRMMELAVKVMGLVLAVPLALLCGFSSEVLAFWLGEPFRRLGTLMTLQLCTLVINLGVLPLLAVSTALNKVKLPAILSCCLGLSNLLLALYVVNETTWGYYGVAAVGVLVLTLKNGLFTPVYAAYILKIPLGSFFKPIANGVLAFSIVFLFTKIFRDHYTLNSFVDLGFIVLSICTVLTLPLIWGGLSSGDRKILAEMAPQNSRVLSKKILLVRD